jgi:hypothetical protein
LSGSAWTWYEAATLTRYYVGVVLVVGLVTAPYAAGATGRTLPFTGMPIWPILALGATLFGAGLLLFISEGRRTRKEREGREAIVRPARRPEATG